ncbi:FAD-dependent oxidoreductase [Candidatus Micrarchaeota archaeon]|nr:FAD-dependent oxidoreductase [Candidatus Micrarchaeota archaeon]
MPAKKAKPKVCDTGAVFTEEQAVEEAKRCIQCPLPMCEQGCPAHRPIKEVNRLIAERKFDSALALVMGTNPFPSITSRVCAQETQCEGHCILAKAGKAIKIGKLEEFLSEYGEHKLFDITKIGKRAAVVGSGPAGLSCAYELALHGLDVQVFEKSEKLGGIVGQSIPDFRLAGEIAEGEIKNLKKMGVKFETGRNVTSIKALLTEFDFVFLGIGAGTDMCLGTQGEETFGVTGAMAFLQRAKWGKLKLGKGESVVVIGGGNSAIDAVRTAKKQGANALLAYRRTEKEMPARAVEIEHAKKEGVKFKFLLSPKEFLAEGKQGKAKLRAIVFDVMQLGKPDESGRQRPESTGKTREIKAQHAVVACGQSPAVQVMNDAGIDIDEKGLIKVNGKFRTSTNRVYAAGDCITGPKTAIEAIRDGRAAGKAILEEAG